eukprot:s4497_g5.t3
MEGLPSGAAESPSRQAAKESLAELQPAPLYSGYSIGSKLPSPLRCLRRSYLMSSSLHSAQPTQPLQPVQVAAPLLHSRPRPPLPSLPRAARRLLLPKEDSRMKPCRHSSASKLAQDDRLRTGAQTSQPEDLNGRPPQPGQNGSETSAWASLRRGHWSRFCNLPLLI